MYKVTDHHAGKGKVEKVTMAKVTVDKRPSVFFVLLFLLSTLFEMMYNVTNFQKIIAKRPG